VSLSVSGDLRTLAYTAEGANDLRAYVKPIDNSSAAVLRYTAPKTPSVQSGLGAYINADGTYLLVYDYVPNTPNHIYVVNVATGLTTRLGANMPGIVDTRFALFHPYEPTLIMAEGQTAGPYQPDVQTVPTTHDMFLGDAADPANLTRIGRPRSPGEHAGEGIYYSRDPRIIYYGEYRATLVSGSSISDNLWAYDRVTHFETPVVRFATGSDRGIQGSGWLSPDLSRMCIGVYEPTTVAYDGPARFYAMNMADPASAMSVSPVLADISQCTFGSDNRTMIYRIFALNRNTQHAYSVDSLNPATPVLLAPNGEAGSKQGAWHAALRAMRMAIAYFDYDGSPQIQNTPGRYYVLPLDGTGSPFLFSDSYIRPGSYTTYFYDLSDDGSFLLYGRPKNGIAALELMSTHGLNLSIPLSRAGETIGVKFAGWMHSYPP
jgi:hypothetical protein